MKKKSRRSCCARRLPVGTTCKELHEAVKAQGLVIYARQENVVAADIDLALQSFARLLG